MNGSWRNVGIAVGRKAVNREQAAQYRDLVESLVRENPKGIALLTVVQPNSTPDPGARDVMVQMFRDLWRDMRAVAFVVEGKGFAAAAQRGVMSALLLATGRGAKIKIFSDLKLAVGWLADELSPLHPKLGEEGIREQLSQAVDEVQRVANTLSPPASVR